MALGLSGCPDDDSGVEFRHGSIKIEFHRGDGVGDSPFIGTTVMQIRLDYEACLIDFYKANPQWRVQGIDGETVFGGRDLGGEGWQDELCERGSIDCEVIEFRQQIDTDAGGQTGNFLQVSYAIKNSADIENRTIHFGPVPLPELAECEAGSVATVRVASGAARGLDGVPPEGTQVWEMQKFDPDRAAANQGASIGIDAKFVD